MGKWEWPDGITPLLGLCNEFLTMDAIFSIRSVIGDDDFYEWVHIIPRDFLYNMITIGEELFIDQNALTVTMNVVSIERMQVKYSDIHIRHLIVTNVYFLIWIVTHNVCIT